MDMDKDITNQVGFGDLDGECLSLIKCVCGIEFPYWEFVLSIYRDSPSECEGCGRKLYFHNRISVYEVIENI